MSDDTISDLDKQLEEFQESRNLLPIEVKEELYSYILRQSEESAWQVRKLDGSKLVQLYTVRSTDGNWTCNCPAAWKGYQCKHKTWIQTCTSIISKFRNA